MDSYRDEWEEEMNALLDEANEIIAELRSGRVDASKPAKRLPSRPNRPEGHKRAKDLAALVLEAQTPVPDFRWAVVLTLGLWFLVGSLFQRFTTQ